MNHTLKKTSTKLCQETHEPWVQLLPIALLGIATAPKPSLRLSPFEMTWETPPHPRYFTRWENKPEFAAFYLGQVEKAIVDYANRVLPAPPRGNLEETPPPAPPPLQIHPGAQVLLKTSLEGGLPGRSVATQVECPY